MDKIIYTVKQDKRARRVRISVHSSGAVVVTIPHRAPIKQAEYFVQTKAGWIKTVQERMRRRFLNKTPLKQSRKEYKSLKSRALSFVTDRIKHYNVHYNFSFNKISIRMQKSRWGSCSRKGNLNFNYTLLKIPQELADYIIVHELCHLKELNHGPQFWNLVAETIPNHRERRKQLKNSYVHIS